MPLTKIQSLGITDGTIVNADINASAAIASTKLSGVTSGLTEADQWRLTTSFSDPDNAFITSNLERVDDTGYSVLGTGMTESSGVFTFPSTGYYLVTATFSVNITSIDQDLTLYIYTTTDNSSYIGRNIIRSGGSDLRADVNTSSIIFDVTSTANCKVKFYAESIGAGTVMGSSTTNETNFTFIRLGDT